MEKKRRYNGKEDTHGMGQDGNGGREGSLEFGNRRG